MAAEALSATLLLCGLAAAALAVVEPALVRVDDALFERRVALARFEGLAAEVDRVRRDEPARREPALRLIRERVARLQAAWREAGVSGELLPVLELRPDGPVLVLADLGAAGGEDLR